MASHLTTPRATPAGGLQETMGDHETEYQIPEILSLNRGLKPTRKPPPSKLLIWRHGVYIFGRGGSLPNPPGCVALAIDIPTDDVLIKHAEGILAASAAWKEGKSFHNRIRTYVWDEPQPQQPKNHASKNKEKTHRWYCLVVKIQKDEISFNKLWSKLGKNQVWHHKR